MRHGDGVQHECALWLRRQPAPIATSAASITIDYARTGAGRRVGSHAARPVSRRLAGAEYFRLIPLSAKLQKLRDDARSLMKVHADIRRAVKEAG